MRSIRLFVPLFVFLFLAGNAIASEDRWQSEEVSACFVIHGRLSFTNGNPSVRIWHIGTKRILGVDGDEHPAMPSKLLKLLDWNTKIYADFNVCPVTPERKGWMQMVYIESAKKLVIERYFEDNQSTVISLLKGDIRDNK